MKNFKIIFFILSIIFFCLNTEAKDVTWTGAVDNNWHNKYNWMCDAEDCIPEAGDDVTIGGGVVIYAGQTAYAEKISISGQLSISLGADLSVSSIVNGGSIYIYEEATMSLFGSGVGLLNSGNIYNEGTITLYGYDVGIRHNSGILDNKQIGEIQASYCNRVIENFASQYREMISNSGFITAEEISEISISNSGNFINSGFIEVDQSLWNSDSLTNFGEIGIIHSSGMGINNLDMGYFRSASSSSLEILYAKGDAILNSGTLELSGSLFIDVAEGHGIYMQYGSLYIDGVDPVIQNVFGSAISLEPGTVFRNYANNLVLGPGIGEYGIESKNASVVNQREILFPKISIFDCGISGILNDSISDFTNEGVILIDSSFEYGVINRAESFFENETSSFLIIKDVTWSGILNEGESGIFSNLGTIEIDSPGTNGIENKGTFRSEEGGRIEIKNAATGVLNQGDISVFFVDGGIANLPGIHIDSCIVGINIADSALFQTGNNADLLISNSFNEGLLIENESVLENLSKIEIKNSGKDGLLVTDGSRLENQLDTIKSNGGEIIISGKTGLSGIFIDGETSEFLNHSGIEIKDSVELNGLHLANPEFENAGSIRINAYTGNAGIYIDNSVDPFSNLPDKSIYISGGGEFGVQSSSAGFFNSGRLSIDDKKQAIYNQFPGTMANSPLGTIDINTPTATGLINDHEFINAGMLRIQDFPDASLQNNGRFINSTCATFRLGKAIINSDSLINKGFIQSYLRDDFINSGVILNTGIINDVRGPFFENAETINEKLIIQSIDTSWCVGIPMAKILKIGGDISSYHISEYWLGSDITNEDGFYDREKNTFTAASVTDFASYYLNINDIENDCEWMANLRISDGITANNDCVTDTTDTGTGSPSDLIHTNVLIYPNPGSSTVFIERSVNSTESDAIIRIIDLSGRTLMEKENCGNLVSFQTGHLENGLYLIQIRMNDQLIQSFWVKVKKF